MSKLRDYIESYHGIILLDSELDDILTLARQEIELPNGNDIEDEFPVIEYEKRANEVFLKDENKWKLFSCQARDNKLKQEGAIWALAKVVNPYPKVM